MSQSLSETEKDALTQIQTSSPSLINGRDLIWAITFFFFIFVICTPKIYLASQIYYVSRDLFKTENYLTLLEEENHQLKRELEDFKFQQLLNLETLK